MVGKSILQQNLEYWTQRAPGYSQVNRWELENENHDTWQNALCRLIEGQFPHKKKKDLRILEIGTGPGFLAILLAEAGYTVTAIDLTASMLEEARKNAGELGRRIDFYQMNAEELPFQAETFDLVLARNVTWNLPHPEQAYRHWCRVLKPGGMLLNFDANWYGYLYDQQARAAYDQDRENTAAQGYQDQNVGENFDVMEHIARKIPLSAIARPAWDVSVLEQLGMEVRTDLAVWKQVWSREEKVSFASTPMFLVQALRQG